MTRPRSWQLGCLLLLAVVPGAGAADPPAAPDNDREVLALAAKIDRQIAAGWIAAKVKPAALADDAEFLRRVYLDLAGRIPSVTEARMFLRDESPDKRLRLVERLLDGPRYVTHMTNVWRALLLPEAAGSIQARFLAPGFEFWLSQQLEKNVGYDQLVREILTTPLSNTSGGVFDLNTGGSIQATPIAYYLAKENSSENLAASTARAFLGIRLECAQCHDHPFAKWKRDQFWQYAAFFAGLKRQPQGDDFFLGGGQQEEPDKKELTIPGTNRVVKAAFPDGTEPVWKPKVSPRATLAEWVTATGNPYFARAAVNRMWFYFFGIALVEPVDEMVGAESSASHPELLDLLAREFAAHKFDLKFLLRAITASRAYQLTSTSTEKKPDNPRLFARMPLRGLSPEQLFDSLAEATGYQEDARINAGFFPAGALARADFLNKFANQSDRPTEFQTTILQALALMNGKLVTDATSLERSEMLAGLLDAPFLTTTERIETLYLATLSRKPRAEELARAVKFVQGREGEDRDKVHKQALADLFWALLNNGEFVFNH